MLKKSLQDKTLISLDVYERTWPNSTTQGVLSHCKGGQLRWKEPSPFSFTLSSSENSPEFRTTLQDSTGNYHKTEVHYQRFCFEDQRGKYRQTNTNWKDDINVLLSLVKMLLENTYFSCLISICVSIHPFFISVPGENETHCTLSGRENRAFPWVLKNWYPRFIKTHQKCMMC